MGSPPHAARLLHGCVLLSLQATVGLPAASSYRNLRILCAIFAGLPQTLATGHHAPKLFAMLAGALGAREPQPLRRPRNADKAKDKAKAAAGGSGQDGLMAELLGLDSAGHEADTDCCEHDVACVSCKWVSFVVISQRTDQRSRCCFIPSMMRA